MTRRLIGVSVAWLGISMAADGVPSVLLPHRLMSTGHNEAATLGLVTLASLALAALVQPFAGRASDFVGRWPVIAAGALAAVSGFGLLLAPDTVLAGALLVMLGISVAQAGYQPLLPDLVPGEQRGRASGLKSALDVGGATLGFLVLAAFLVEGEVPAAVALLVTVVLGAFAVAYGLLRHGPRQPGRAVRAPRGGMADVLRHLPSGFLGIVLARFFFLLGIYSVGRFLFLFIGQRLGLDADAAAGQAGLALGLLALASVAAALPAGWLTDRVGRRALMLSGGALAAAGIGLLPMANSIELILAFGLLLALGSAAFSTSSWATLADVSASADAGRLLALANLGTAGAAAGAGAFGLIIDAGNSAGPQLGYTVAFALAAFASMAGGVLAWRVAAPVPTIRNVRLAEVTD